MAPLNRAGRNIIFNQQFFHLSSIMLGELPSEESIFHLAKTFLRECASTDLQRNYFPLKLLNHSHSEIF